jgi:UDP-N-acetylglucosamine 1-carboxyvinyltransferase
MSKYKIIGPAKLSGEVTISGAKNAALKLISAAILADSPSKISNVPKIIDIKKMIHIVESLGAKISFNDNTVLIDPSSINSTDLEESYVKKLRGSVVLVGPMLAKFGKVKLAQPGGCLIGVRAIDDHLDLFTQLGVKIDNMGDHYIFTGKPKTGDIILNKLSVTATENAIMATVLSPGTTHIHVAAAEPEVADLANYLNRMGAKITGAGTHDIIINGVDKLTGVEYTVMPDRIEAGTYLLAAIVTNSCVEISPIIPDHMSIVLRKLERCGARFKIEQSDKFHKIITDKHDQLKSFNIDTRTYPGFPTDLQSVYAVFATQTKGSTKIFETLYEGRYGYVEEIRKMGAKINIETAHIVSIDGPQKLKGTKINALDIRGGAALVLAALVAEGETEIDNIELIERGYEDMDKKLAALGVDITLEK